MYSEQQAKNGFKTFVATLAVSLILFGSLYYLITDFSNDVDIEDTSANKQKTVAYDPPDVKGVTTSQNVQSVFGEIQKEQVTTQPSTVLATHDTAVETTEATVPDTGSETMLGTVMAITAFSATIYVVLSGPRKLALVGFEKDVLREIEKE